jgi:hypothetical protein
VPEQNKKLTGFEALYKVDQEKRQQQQKVETVGEIQAPVTTDLPKGASAVGEANRRKSNGSESKSESKLVRNITQPKVADTFEPTTFKADRRKVLALKRLALELEPARKLQDLFDEALADVLAKYGRKPE